MSNTYTAVCVCVRTLANCYELGGRYKANVPSQAAKKIASRVARDHGLGIYYVTVREITRGSEKKEHRYKVRILRTTAAERQRADDSDVAFVPKTYARIDAIYSS